MTPEMRPLIKGTLAVLKEKTEDIGELPDSLALVNDFEELSHLSRLTITSIFPDMLQFELPLEPIDNLRVAKSLYSATWYMAHHPSLVFPWTNGNMVPILSERIEEVGSDRLDAEEEKEAMKPFEYVLHQVRGYDIGLPPGQQLSALYTFLDLNNDMRLLTNSLRREKRVLLGEVTH